VPPTDAVTGRRRPRGIARQRPGGSPAAKTQPPAWRSDGHRGVTSVAARSGSVSGVAHAAGCWPRRLNVIARHLVAIGDAVGCSSRQPVAHLGCASGGRRSLPRGPAAAGGRATLQARRRVKLGGRLERRRPARSSNASGPSNTATSPTGACATRGRPRDARPAREVV